MPRANRYHLPGYVWHLTHRCHNREFLLKYKQDRIRYRYWLYEACKRFGLRLLNYIITCNHVHLLVFDDGDPGVIENSMQLVEGRIAQEFNRRKGRMGAFWQDRYHATAVQTGKHFRNCMIYIDLNMVRAGQVNFPGEWTHGGYREILNSKPRYRIIDEDTLISCSGFNSKSDFLEWHESAIKTALEKPSHRQREWTESVAVGDQPFLKNLSQKLGMRSRFLDFEETASGWCLQESPAAYDAESCGGFVF